ncbi:hypothetical protein [Clostridium botulinum]|uniref:hypothetical protein n=1 Tax=Clostridium botulinum TaxID=1491 RepID=UPI00067AE20E|nr:hypothetical protein [Clostridium botulinum]
MSSYRKSINICDLIINPENYRHESVSNEMEAVVIMLKKYSKKIKALLIDILQNGTNPSDLLIVTPRNSKYIVLEGNRRLIACKILENPKVLKQIDINSYENFNKEIKKHGIYEKISVIECCVFDDPEEANRWIKLKHTGENFGVGTVPWNNLQRKRFDASMGKNDLALSVVKYAQSSSFYRNDLKNRLNNLKLSNLSRLLSDPQVRESIGIYKEKDKLYKKYPDYEISKGLNKIFNDLLTKDFNVNSIYYKAQRQDYISNFSDELLPDSSKVLDKLVPLNIPIENNIDIVEYPNDQMSFENDIDRVESEVSTDLTHKSKENNLDNKVSFLVNNYSPKKNVCSKKDINKRNNLIPRSFNIAISHDRINSIYRELKSLDVNTHPNAIAVLFRVFLEVSSDYFIQRNSLNLKKDSKLKDKIRIILDYLNDNNLIERSLIKPINICISSDHSIFSTNTFNNYVHNKDMRPDPLNLKIAWNQLGEFLKILHKNC